MERLGKQGESSLLVGPLLPKVFLHYQKHSMSSLLLSRVSRLSQNKQPALEVVSHPYPSLVSFRNTCFSSDDVGFYFAEKIPLWRSVHVRNPYLSHSTR